MLPGTKKPRSKKYADLPMVEEYNLTYILKTYGFKILEDYIELEESDNNVNILGVKAVKFGCTIDCLENPLSFESVLQYFRKNTDLLAGFEDDEGDEPSSIRK